MNYQWSFDDQRLQYIDEEWDNFIQQIERNDSIVVIYHADLDGALGGAYALNALKNIIGPRDTQTYWVSTDEYHFVDLRNQISKENPHFAIFLDVAVENHYETLKFLEKNISKGCFIYDHHIIHDSSDFNEKIVIANPTPKKLRPSEKPIPTFLFAHYLAKIHNLPFPDWLALLAIFEEGVDTFFKDEVSDLFLKLYNIRIKNNFRKVFFEETKLGQIGPYLRASFTRGRL